MSKGKGKKGLPTPTLVPNDVRKNGKAKKKHPKSSPAVKGKGKATGRTVGGYSPAKTQHRASQRGK